MQRSTASALNEALRRLLCPVHGESKPCGTCDYVFKRAYQQMYWQRSIEAKAEHARYLASRRPGRAA